MECWDADFHRGIHALRRHEPALAVGHFSRAVRGCPVARSGELARLRYFLGMALQRLGFPHSAVRSWLAAPRAHKGRPPRALLQRFANDYGMAKQRSRELDDWQAFYSVQVMRYLRGFRKRALTSDAERCMLADIIREAWLSLLASGALAGKSAAQKSRLFQAARIDFPLFYHEQVYDPVINVDFRSRERVCAESRCFCGSGLPFLACCGRTPGEEELSSGIF